MKQAIVALAANRGEGESVIVREAINRYLAPTPLVLRETPPPYGTTPPPTPPAPPPPAARPPKKKRAGARLDIS